MICEDGYTVSFQQHELGWGNLIHHHQNGYPDTTNSQQRGGSPPSIRPVEFKRKIILQPATTVLAEPKTLMEKLMQEEQRLRTPRLVPAVEVHPLKICYSVVSPENVNPPLSPSGAESHDGFVLVSQDECALDTLQSVMKISAPEKASTCVRVWSQRQFGKSCRYEVVHLEDLEVEETPEGPLGASVEIKRRKLTIGEWLSAHTTDPLHTQLKVLVEARKTGSSRWPREPLELENRIKVGDFVDAQDSSGKWYEAVVREVNEDTVSVHYLGWASRWDSILKRRRHGKAVEGIMQVGFALLCGYYYSNRN